MKKSLCLMLCALMVFGAGCSSPGSASSATAPPSSQTSAAPSSQDEQKLEDCTIRILTRSFNDATIINRIILKRLNEWAEQNPNIEVVNESVLDEDQFNNKFKIAVSSGDMPTMVSSYGGGGFKAYIEGGLILDLAPYMEQNSDFFGVLTDAAYSTQRYPDIEGTYGFAMDMWATSIYYNKKIFAEQGLEVPATIKEFEAVCDKLLAAGITPMPLGDKNAYLGGHLSGELMMKRFGSGIMYDLADRKKKYTDPEVLEIFELMKKWQDKGYLGDNVTTMDVDAARVMFKTGKSAMLHQQVHLFSPIMETAEATVASEDVGIMPFPYFDDYPENKNAWHSGTNTNYSIAADASEAEIQATIALWKYLFSKEAMQAAIDEGAGAIICTRTDVSDPANVPPAAIAEIMKAYASATDIGKEAGEYDTNPAVRNLLRDSIQGMFAGTSPEETAEKIQKVIG